MKDFQKEKEKLQIELQQLIKQFPAQQWLIALEQALEKMTTPADLDGSFKKVKKTIKKLATFEKRHMDKKNRIQSKELRKLAKKLKKKGHRVTFVGKAWSKQTANWIYFDTVLDIEALQSKYSLGIDGAIRMKSFNIGYLKIKQRKISKKLLNHSKSDSTIYNSYLIIIFFMINLVVLKK